MFIRYKQALDPLGSTSGKWDGWTGIYLCDPKDLHEVYSRRKGKEKEKAYKEINDDEEEEDKEDKDKEEEEEEEEEGEDLEQAQRGAGPSSRKGRKRWFSSGWADREEVDKELMESQISSSPPSLSLPPPPPHASSPANMPWKNRLQRFAFLQALSTEPKYQALVNALDNHIICAPFIYLMANKSNLNFYILEGWYRIDSGGSARLGCLELEGGVFACPIPHSDRFPQSSGTASSAAEDPGGCRLHRAQYRPHSL